MSCASRHSLEDFVAGRLAGQAAQAFDAHLASCPECRVEVARLRALRAVVGNLAPFEPSETDWQRADRAVLAAMDSALDRRAEGFLARFWPAFGLAAVAAAAVALFFALRPGAAPVPSEPVARAPETTPVVAPVVPLAPRVVEPVEAPSFALAIASGSDLRVTHGGVEQALEAPVLEQGDTLALGATPLTLQTAAATGVRVAAGSRLELERLTPKQTTLRLVVGELAAEVKPLAEGQAFAVRTADLLVSVRGTAFRVVREAAATRVEVLHGLVEVSRETGSVMVPGPGSVLVADGAPLPEVRPTIDPATAAAFPLALADLPLAELRQASRPTVVQSEPAGAEVRVDGVVRGTTPLSLLVAPGPHTAELRLPGREPLVAQLGEQLDPRLSFSLLAPRPPAKLPKKPELWVRVPSTDPRAATRREQMAEQVRLHPTVLTECYEYALKRNPDMPGSLTLVVTLGPRGSVREIKTVEPYGKDFLQCARPSILRWELPGAGEMEEFEMPLRLQAR